MIEIVNLKMENKEYKDECDRLSVLEAQNHTAWGRWFCDDGMLCTWVCTPKIGHSVVGKMFCFSKNVDDLRKLEQQQEFYELMSTKVWMGEDGLKQLKRAFKYLNKKSKVQDATS